MWILILEEHSLFQIVTLDVWKLAAVKIRNKNSMKICAYVMQCDIWEFVEVKSGKKSLKRGITMIKPHF
jgi:hypothetical protein